jgi:dUTP pyrophosphatase
MIKNKEKSYNTGYYIYARSSLSKTPLRLANHVGIVDAGYRGFNLGLFDVITKDTTNSDYVANKFDRLIQICAPGLVPIYIELVDKEEDLSDKTERGVGGIGSTGI